MVGGGTFEKEAYIEANQVEAVEEALKNNFVKRGVAEMSLRILKRNFQGSTYAGEVDRAAKSVQDYLDDSQQLEQKIRFVLKLEKK